jgi:hypothetical protein
MNGIKFTGTGFKSNAMHRNFMVSDMKNFSSSSVLFSQRIQTRRRRISPNIFIHALHTRIPIADAAASL